MTLLDTNIISEIMRQKPDENVLHWLNTCDTETLFITTISIAEINYGLQILPKGKRRTDLEIRFKHFTDEAFFERVLLFDERSARFYGELMATSKARGMQMTALDGQIAAIASVYGLQLATRNIKDFQYSGVKLINSFVYSIHT